jgi:hypothetical protein
LYPRRMAPGTKDMKRVTRGDKQPYHPSVPQSRGHTFPWFVESSVSLRSLYSAKNVSRLYGIIPA